MAGNAFSSAVGDGGDFQGAFESVTYGKTTRTEKKLNPATPAPSIPARSGSSGPITSPAASSGGGVASPLTEALYSERTFWSERTTTTPDGMFTLAWTPLKSIRFLDANSAEVVLNFKDAP